MLTLYLWKIFHKTKVKIVALQKNVLNGLKLLLHLFKILYLYTFLH